MNRHLALVEDEEDILANYGDFLEDAGFSVDRYGTKAEAMAGLLLDPPELVLLDIQLHNERDAGYDICIELRRHYSSLPIVFLSSHGSEVDRMSGWRVQADDYIIKPVSPEYLLVRVEHLLRRYDTLTRRLPSCAQPAVPSVPDLALDDHASTARWRGRPVSLTLTQFWILRALYQAQGDVVRHEELMDAARIKVERNTIAAHIKAVRAVFLRVDPAFDSIRTERSRGYRWLPR